MSIKNILFDLDNTLIKNEDDDMLYYKEALSNLGYDENDYNRLYDVIDDYETTFTEKENFYSKNEMLDFVNKKLNKSYSIELIDEVNKCIAKYWIRHPFVKIDTLQYLSSKYDLYVFTNWFSNTQSKRLDNIGIIRYFKNVFGADYYGSKPFKSAFQNVLQKLNCLPNECVMIGDSKLNDIWGARNIGMNAILFNFDGTRDKSDIIVDNYSVISNLTELEKLL